MTMPWEVKPEKTYERLTQAHNELEAAGYVRSNATQRWHKDGMSPVRVVRREDGRLVIRR